MINVKNIPFLNNIRIKAIMLKWPGMNGSLNVENVKYELI